MRSFTRAATLAAGILASTASAAFNAASSTNLVVYWGQGSRQMDLTELCNDPSVDIVNIGFVNGFPRAIGDYPSTNFANACGDQYFKYPNGTTSGLLSSCPGIEPGIKTCQANGKKVLLSLGGGWPLDYYLPSRAVAEYFAEFLWGAFGPQTAAWVAAGKPRPFGDASVDGFDLDIESFMNPAPFPTYQYANYDRFVTHLKTRLFPQGPRSYYISAAPQCVVPDARLSDAISKSHFDFVFVQFYNTPECSARAGYNGISGQVTKFTFDTWVTQLKTKSFNKNVKLYLGLPAGTDGAPNDKPSYLKPEEANKLITHYAKKHPSIFGGVMLWEATVSQRNAICSKPYGTWIKTILNGKFTNTVCPISSSSIIRSSTISRSSTIVSSSTRSSSIITTSSSTLVSSTSKSTVVSSTIKSSSSAAVTSSVVSSSSVPVSSSSSSYPVSSSSSSSSTPAPSSSSSSTPVPSSSAYSTPESSTPVPSSSAYSTPESSTPVTSSSAYSTPESSTPVPSVTLSSSSTEGHVTAPYPTGNSTHVPYPTGNSTDVPYPTGSESSEPPSSVPYPTETASTTPCTTSGTESSTGYSELPETTSATDIYPTDSASSTPCTTSGIESSTEYPEQPSSTKTPEYPEDTTKGPESTPCPESSTEYPENPSSTKTPEYPEDTTEGPESTPCPESSTEGYEYPVPTPSKGQGEYPEYPVPTPSKGHGEYPEYPVPTPSKGHEEYPAPSPSKGHGEYPAPPSNGQGEYPEPSKPAEEYPAYPSYPAVPEAEESSPAPLPTGGAYVPEYPETPDYETVSSTRTVYEYITLTKVPVPGYETPSPAPYPEAHNSTKVYPTASGTGAPSYPTYAPPEFEGAASRASVGISALVVMAAGLFVL